MDSSEPSLPQTSVSVSHQSSFPEDSATEYSNKLVNGVNEDSSSSENEGFLSGDEDELETEPTRPVLVYSDGKSSKGVSSSDYPLVNSTEFFAPETVRPIAKITLDDDDDDDNGSVGEEGDSDGVVLEQGRVVEEEDVKESGFADNSHEVFLEASDGGGAVEKGFDSGDFEGGVSAVENGVQVNDLKNDEKLGEEVKESGLGDAPEVFVEASEGGDLEGVVAVENGIEVNEWDKSEEKLGLGKEVKEEIGFGDSTEVFVEASAGGDSADKGFESGESEGVNDLNKDVEVVVNEESNVQGDVDGGTEHSAPLVVESAHDDDKSKSVVAETDDDDDDVKFSSGGGDSLVDILQVNPLGDGGVAVVGDKVEQIEESEIKGLDASAPAVSLDNEFDPIQQVAEDILDKVADGDAAESGQNVDTGVEYLDDTEHVQNSDITPLEKDESSEFASHSAKAVQDDSDIKIEAHVDERETDSQIEKDGSSEFASHNPKAVQDESKIEASGEGDKEEHGGGDREIDVSVADSKDEGEIFDSTDAAAAKKFLEDLEQQSSAVVSSRDEKIDGQIVTDSDEEEEEEDDEVDTDDEGDGKELFDTATLAALLKAASGAGGQDGSGGITITSQDGSRLFSVERPAGLGPSLQSGKPGMRTNRTSIFNPSISSGRAGTESDNNLSKEEKIKLEKLQQIRIKFLRLVQRVGFTPDESIVAQVLYRFALLAGRQTGQMFSLDAAKESASKLEDEGKDDLDFSINILVLGKTGVGKSATVNAIFGETKTDTRSNAYGPATTSVTEIVGVVDGVKIRVFDTPGLKSSALEQNFNRKVLSMVKKVTKKSPPDIVLYVDRLDLQTRDLNDLPMLRSITGALGSSIWRNVIVTLTHGASAPPDGPTGSPLSYEVFVAQRSHIVQQTIGQAVGDLRLMNPSLMNPVSLVENHPSCRKNRDGQKVLPNGQSWRPVLLLLCFSMKILAEAGSLSKSQESLDHRRLFGFRTRAPPLPYLLSWLLQSRTHPKLSADQGGVDNGDSDIEMADLSDSDLDEEEDEYDQLPPFKPLRKSQLAKLNREQQKAYLEEYDYRVKLLQKKQWREELKRMREMKKKGKTDVNEYGYLEEEGQEDGSPAAVPVPLPDMVLPPSFDSDNPAYRYRFLEPTSQLLTRPVLDTHSWDHDCGYDGVNLEQSLAIINKFPAAVTVQITKDKKDFSLHLDSSVAAKHGDNGSTMAGFDIQNIGKQLAYIVRGETKFKNLKRNKTAAGVSVTFLGENVSTGLKVEDQIALGKRLVLVGSTGTVRSQSDAAYGANVEVRLREADFPVGQDQSSLSFSLVKWRGDLALGANFQSQFSVGRSYKMAVRAGLNNKLSGQISVRTSSSDQLQIALVAILPIARAIYKNFWPGASENYSIY